MIVKEFADMKEQLAESTRQREMDRLSQQVKFSEDQKLRKRRMNQVIFAASVVITGVIIALLLR